MAFTHTNRKKLLYWSSMKSRNEEWADAFKMLRENPRLEELDSLDESHLNSMKRFECTNKIYDLFFNEAEGSSSNWMDIHDIIERFQHEDTKRLNFIESMAKDRRTGITAMWSPNIDSNLKSVEADNWLSKERNKEVYYSLTPLGINNYKEKTEEKKLQRSSNIKSWIAIAISIIALIKSFL